MTYLLVFGSLGVLFAAYGYLGRVAVAKGYRPGESGSLYTLAWPFYIRAAPYFLATGAALLLGAAVATLV